MFLSDALAGQGHLAEGRERFSLCGFACALEHCVFVYIYINIYVCMCVSERE